MLALTMAGRVAAVIALARLTVSQLLFFLRSVETPVMISVDEDGSDRCDRDHVFDGDGEKGSRDTADDCVG